MRPCIEFIKNRFRDRDIIGAEIGVYRGDNALDILRSLPNVRFLFLIDPYEKYDEWRDRLKPRIEDAKRTAKERLTPFNDRVKWIYKRSEDCLEDIPTWIDFVYIDGNHSYEFVKKDIEFAMKITKLEAVIGGHDYKKGVKKAVDEFCNTNNIQLHLKLEPKRHSDWWFIRP